MSKFVWFKSGLLEMLSMFQYVKRKDNNLRRQEDPKIFQKTI